jgi:molybdenum cofactor biosynthesis enzyme MoaA
LRFILPKADVLSLEELDRLCSAVIAKGVRKLRRPSGTPLATSHFGPCLNRSE